MRLPLVRILVLGLAVAGRDLAFQGVPRHSVARRLEREMRWSRLGSGESGVLPGGGGDDGVVEGGRRYLVQRSDGLITGAEMERVHDRGTGGRLNEARRLVLPLVERVTGEYHGRRLHALPSPHECVSSPAGRGEVQGSLG